MAKARTSAEPRAAISANPVGMSRIMSADHVGVSPSLFDEMVKDGRMPQPRMAGARVLWDRYELEAHFRALPMRGSDRRNNSFADWQ